MRKNKKMEFDLCLYIVPFTIIIIVVMMILNDGRQKGMKSGVTRGQITFSYHSNGKISSNESHPHCLRNQYLMNLTQQLLLTIISQLNFITRRKALD